MAGSNRSFWRSSRGLLIAFPNADDPPSGNHESLESKISKRKKARPNTRLSCKIEYFIETTPAYLSGRSAFFTDDYTMRDRCAVPRTFPQCVCTQRRIRIGRLSSSSEY